MPILLSFWEFITKLLLLLNNESSYIK